MTIILHCCCHDYQYEHIIIITPSICMYCCHDYKCEGRETQTSPTSSWTQLMVGVGGPTALHSSMMTSCSITSVGAGRIQNWGKTVAETNTHVLLAGRPLVSLLFKESILAACVEKHIPLTINYAV